MSRDRFVPRCPASVPGVPFASAEEAWFWFVQAQEARASGARFVAGLGLVARPCEPVDVLRVVDRLYRQRRLLHDHLRVLVHYGRRLMAPDAGRRAEARSALLWQEALAAMEPVLCAKGIVQPAARTGPEPSAA